MTATKLNPAALTTAQIVQIFAKAGTVLNEAEIAADVAAGAPTNADGTLHLVHYTAWLAKEVA